MNIINRNDVIHTYYNQNTSGNYHLQKYFNSSPQENNKQVFYGIDLYKKQDKKLIPIWF